MIYVIDGHNLIGKMPNIDLADPDDEEKLVLRLQNWARGDRKRRVVLYFDSGPFGGIAPHLTGLGVQVHFTKIGQTADEVIIQKLRKVKNPQEYTLVTSDREIIAVARKRRIGHILSEEFVTLLELEKAADAAVLEEPEQVPADLGEGENPEISEADVAEWMEVFSKVPRYRPKRQAKPVIRPRDEEKKEPEPEKPPPTADELKAGASMTQEDMEAWLAVFGDKPDTGKVDTPAPPKRPKNSDASTSKNKNKPNQPEGKVRKYGDGKLTPDEVQEWLDIFGKS